ncbi:HAD family hydrolase [Methyloversatilis sp.]|uniref:histidinol-phosphatase n=1 Tax=Methyloversatilis sp. TaxID=2569862 RepID=UPI003F6F43F4
MELVLFDLDNTLLAGDSDFEWAQFLISRGVLDRELYEARNATFFEQYKAGTLDIHEFLNFQLAPLARHRREALDAWHAEFMVQQIRPRLTDGARGLVNGHLETGALCAIVTATNSFITGPIARELDIPHLIATVPAQVNGEFTGQPRGTPAFREGKVERVERWLEELGLYMGSFRRTSFYSDSLNDLPLLSRVNHPVAVDPDPTLEAHARAKGWQIMNLHTAGATDGSTENDD